MSTRTIEPIHVVLPDAEGGYYRFGELPGMIADAMYPECPDAADDDEDLLLMLRHAWDGVEAFKKDLQRAAELAAGEPGYLHVVENSASKRPLEWRMGSPGLAERMGRIAQAAACFFYGIGTRAPGRNARARGRQRQQCARDAAAGGYWRCCTRF